MTLPYYKRHGVVTADIGEYGDGGVLFIDLLSNTRINGFHCDGMEAEESITLSACEADGTEIVKIASITIPAGATVSCPFFAEMGTVWTRYLNITVGGTPVGNAYIYVGA